MHFWLCVERAGGLSDVDHVGHDDQHEQYNGYKQHNHGDQQHEQCNGYKQHKHGDQDDNDDDDDDNHDEDEVVEREYHDVGHDDNDQDDNDDNHEPHEHHEYSHSDYEHQPHKHPRRGQDPAGVREDPQEARPQAPRRASHAEVGRRYKRSRRAGTLLASLNRRCRQLARVRSRRGSEITGDSGARSLCLANVPPADCQSPREKSTPIFEASWSARR